MARRYIDLDSTYRNRTEFSNPCKFDIRFGTSDIKRSPFQSADPILDGATYDNAVTAGGSTATDIISAAGASTTDNFYYGTVLEVAGEYREITAYDGTTLTFTVSPAFGGAPGAGVPWKVRRANPVDSGTLAAAGTISTIILPVGSSTVDNFYQGNYIMITSGALSGTTRVILSYVGGTRTATVPTLPSAPAGVETYDILTFTKDNEAHLRYSGSMVDQTQLVAHEITLDNLIVPTNATIKSPLGGTINDYPYLYVIFGAKNAISEEIIYSNNPNSGKVAFKVPIDDDITTLPFTKLKSRMVQTMKFKPNSNMEFELRLPSGHVLAYDTDTFSPLPANSALQVSATFCIRRLSLKRV